VLRGYDVLSQGELWGREALILQDERLHETFVPVSVTFTEMQYLTQKAFTALLKEFPEQRKVVRLAILYFGIIRLWKAGASVSPSFQTQRDKNKADAA